MYAIANLKTLADRRCAFCKNWYDPTNSHIQPHIPHMGQWKYDRSAREKCLLKKGSPMASFNTCPKFESKI